MIDVLKAAAVAALKAVTDAEPLVASLLSAVLDGDDEARQTVRDILPAKGASEAAAEELEK